ncbi:serine hydrolase domain-containing protein [Blastococcus brunescens]|uniref:Serine hydrolase domain-containing protein n=1 Tax=Blastococcus brunescens TaxID=1564165 RepID=A0ABZ1AUZ4_9ACTN|nr:serine hydrolase domain-containing protein [Blastococcus sp. BMG 8361]WRL62400.1 serine hydrolase domain-containing protein [Blastococcus sp. BMG 8361]
MTSATDTIRSAAGYLRSWVEAQAAHRRVPGVQVAVRSGDELVLSAAVGVADADAGTLLTPEHLFRIASHSKTFTATVVLQLVEAGRMRLDDPIGQYVPELADGGSPIARATLRELLGHQSGVVRDGEHADFWQLEQPFPDRDGVVAEVLRGGVVHRRNEHFKYSNIGYALVGLAIEAATGRSYAEQVRAAVLEPLGLTRTGPEYEPARAVEFAAGHTGLLLGEDARRTIGHVDTRAMAPATGFYSTAEELTVYGSAHCPGDDRLLTDDSKRLMQRLESVVTAYGSEIGRYGMGMALQTVGERQLVGHSGGYPGHSTLTLVDPAATLVVSVLTNAIDGPAEDLAVGLMKLIDVALKPRAEVAAPPAGTPPLATFTGRFASLWGCSTSPSSAGGWCWCGRPCPTPAGRGGARGPGRRDAAGRRAAGLRAGGRADPARAGRRRTGRVAAVRRRDLPAGRGVAPPSSGRDAWSRGRPPVDVEHPGEA